MTDDYPKFSDFSKEETRQCKHYFRYCDDMVILHFDKHHLSQLKEEIETYLLNNLKLILKPNRQIFPVDARGIDLLGYRFFHDYILLRKSIAIKFKQRIKFIKTHWPCLTPPQILNSVMSYYGWSNYANCNSLIKRYINQDVYSIFNKVCKREGVSNPLRKSKMKRIVDTKPERTGREKDKAQL